ELAQDLAAVRTNTVTSVMQSAPLMPSAMESDATLGPNAISGSLRPAPVVPADKSGAKQAAKPPAATKPATPKKFETVFAIALLSVAGLGAAVAGGWYWYAHRKPAPPPAQAVTIPVPQPQPQQIEALPPTPPPAAAPETTPAKPGTTPGGTPATAPKDTKPSAAKPTPGKPTATK